MPNEEKTKPGRSLKQRVKRAAELTAQQQKERDQSSGRKTEKGPSKRKATAELKEAQASSKKRAEEAAALEAESSSLPERGSEKNSSTSDKGKTTKRKASSEQKKAAREEDSKKAKDVAKSIFRKLRVLLIIVIVIVVLIAAIYPMAKTYYTSLRQEQQLQAELDAVNERNEKIEKENESLDTEEGIESQARKELGYVQKGEKGTVVTNADEDMDTSTDLPEQVDSDEITAPDTWYYDILDKLFRVST